MSKLSSNQQHLLTLFQNRDIDAIIRHIREVMESPEFPQLHRQWINDGTLNFETVKIGDVTNVLLGELEGRLLLGELEGHLEQQGELDINDNFFTIEKQLEGIYGKEISEIYIKSVMPTGLIGVIRDSQRQGDPSKLSEKLVDQYKKELVRIDKGRQKIQDVLQQFSHFPTKHVRILSKLVQWLYRKAKSDYKFISTKPYFQQVLEIAEVTAGTEDTDNACFQLFSNYQDGSLEPSLSQQVAFRIAMDELLQQLTKWGILTRKEYKKSSNMLKISGTIEASDKLTLQLRKILEEVLGEISKDRDTILSTLASIFLDEYHCAEKLMKMRHQMICRELAFTNEYLKRINTKSEKIKEENLDKICVAQEKSIGLAGIFNIRELLREKAAKASTMELERIALGISTSVSPEQLAEWIRIYSILFSNADFLAYADEPVDFSFMRNHISNLSTFHLTLSVAELKTAVERGLQGEDDEKSQKFKRFNEALKYRLQALIHKKEKEEKSLMQMVKELEFLGDESIQFVIADTFEGFQMLADAFRSTENDYFVKNRTALMEESRKLYKEICDQCLKQFVYKLAKPIKKPAAEKALKKMAWYKRLLCIQVYA